MDVKDIVKNIIHGVYNTIPHILKNKVKNCNVRSIAIKTTKSISLPIYNCLTKDEIEVVKKTENK